MVEIQNAPATDKPTSPVAATNSTTSQWRWYLIALGALGLLLTVSVWLAPAPGAMHWLANSGPLLAVLLATAGCFYVGFGLSPINAMAARAWWLMGCAMLCYLAALAFSLFQTQEILLATPLPALTNFFRFLQQPLLWAALLTLLWPHLRKAPRSMLMRLLSDALIVVLAVLVLAWIVLLEPIYSLSLAEGRKFQLLFFPLAEIIHLFLALVLFSTGSTRSVLTRARVLLVLGLLFLVASGLYLSYLGLWSDSQHTSWLNAGHIWSGLFIAAAALVYRSAFTPHTSAEVEQPVESNEQMLAEDAAALDDASTWRGYVLVTLPYAATLGVCIFLVWFGYAQNKTDELNRLLPVLALMLAIVTRQMLTVRDNLQLSHNLHEANSQLGKANYDLEQSVEERTRHLATLHGITSTLNTSLDRRTVLRVTLEKTMMAVGSDSGGIWLYVSRDDAVTAAALPGLMPEDESNLSATGTFWTMVHSHGFGDDERLQDMVRDLAIASAAEGREVVLSPATRDALQSGEAPPPDRLIMVPIRWQSSLIGVMSLLRRSGKFSFEDRALVESVALEAGTSLQNARLYYEARHRADRDSVTSLLNHRAVQESLNEMLRSGRSTGGTFSIVMMDLNNFKFFNDTYGHPVGDDVLRTVAQCLREVCRTEDMLGRYGGDEFIALLPDTDEDGATNVCRRIAASLDQHHFEAEPGSRIPINVSFGSSTYPQDGNTALELLTRADTSLYDHKRSGGAITLPKQGEITTEVRDEMRRLKSRASGGSFGVLDALVTAIDNKDHYTRRHSEEVTHMALLIARELDYSEEALRAVRISGLLHDVGKIAVPDEVLRHPGRLTDEQWGIMKQHPVFGALIVKDLPHLDEVLGGVRHHHERWDGKGYPDALEGADIPPLGRLLAVPDCFSAMTTDRPYRKGYTPQAALAEIEKSIGTQFDPTIANAFLRVMRRELSGESGEIEIPREVVQTTSSDGSGFDEIDPATLPARASSL